MSEPAEGGWPWVAAGVPYAIEILHPGYEIDPFDRFAVPGLQLLLIGGAPRVHGFSERYAAVEAVDEADHVLEGRALFLRSIVGVTDAYAMALRAMATMMRRADERPLTSEPSFVTDIARGRVTAPAIAGRTLTFWIRSRPDLPYVSPITVDLDTGAWSGDSS